MPALLLYCCFYSLCHPSPLPLPFSPTSYTAWKEGTAVWLYVARLFIPSCLTFQHILLYRFIHFNPACLRPSLLISALVNTTAFSPRLRVLLMCVWTYAFLWLCGVSAFHLAGPLWIIIVPLPARQPLKFLINCFKFVVLLLSPATPPLNPSQFSCVRLYSQCTSTRMLTLVLPTALNTWHDTGSVKKEWSAVVTITLSLAPSSIMPPFAHLKMKQISTSHKLINVILSLSGSVSFILFFKVWLSAWQHH